MTFKIKIIEILLPYFFVEEFWITIYENNFYYTSEDYRSAIQYVFQSLPLYSTNCFEMIPIPVNAFYQFHFLILNQASIKLPPPTFWRDTRRRRVAAALHITTCPTTFKKLVLSPLSHTFDSNCTPFIAALFWKVDSFIHLTLFF
jgi:hypothetical protein